MPRTLVLYYGQAGNIEEMAGLWLKAPELCKELKWKQAIIKHTLDEAGLKRCRELGRGISERLMQVS